MCARCLCVKSEHQRDHISDPTSKLTSQQAAIAISEPAVVVRRSWGEQIPWLKTVATQSTGADHRLFVRAIDVTVWRRTQV